MQFLITAIVAVVLLVSVESSCPSGCVCTDTPVHVNCSSRGLESIPTDLPNNTYELYLHHNKITSINSGTLNNLTNLDRLELQYNDISVITNNTFNNLPKLRYLSLQSNSISVIEGNAFNNLPNLKSLLLSSNKITSIKSDMFNNLQNLNTLSLQNNDISVIEDNAFNNLPNLKSLSLRSNSISVIEDNAFNNLPNLTSLFLLFNTITLIKSDMFNNLQNLNTLWLDRNEISVIEDNAFNNLPNLQVIYLHDNKITSIKSDTFNNLTNLKNLFLRNNSISYVSESAFENLPNLTKLHFDMYCRGCGNIPFWRWLKRSQKFTTSVTCNDYDGESLAKLQPNNSTNCFMDPCYRNPCLSNGQCTNNGKGSAFCSCHGDWTGSQCELSPCSNVVCNDGECYYNESGIAKCFNQAATKSDDNYTAVYTGVGGFIAATLMAVIIVHATLRYRGEKKQQKRSTRREYVNTTFSDDHANSGVRKTEINYVPAIPEVEEENYDTI